jgi:hypothetical protein
VYAKAAYPLALPEGGGYAASANLNPSLFLAPSATFRSHQLDCVLHLTRSKDGKKRLRRVHQGVQSPLFTRLPRRLFFSRTHHHT